MLKQIRFPNVFKERIKNGHRQQGEQQTHALPADHQNSDRAIGRRAGPAADDQRDHTGDQRHRGHQDRPQAVAVGANDGVIAAHSLRMKMAGVVDLQDRVLLNDTEQKQNAERRKYIQTLAGHQRGKQRERYRKRQREQDRDRVDERFELRRQDQIHKDERQQKSQRE